MVAALSRREDPCARAARFGPAAAPVLVVKVGSALLVAADGVVRRDWAASLAADIAARREQGQKIVLVSSGAIALGSMRLNLARGGRANLEDAQAAAACGQILLAGLWADLLGAHGIEAAQMLVTLGDFEDRRRYLNAAATLTRLLGLGALPILNENDSVATEEIRFGDNDRLAARAAQAAGAGGLLLLSDVEGLYTGNPATDPSARLVEDVHELGAVAGMAEASSGSGLGSGGMAAKVEAARMALAAGVAVAIASGREPHPLARFGETGRGTIFHARGGLQARKAWLAGRMQVAGRLHVDAGAVAALRAGRSLLPAGVTRVDGDFARGDAVDVLGPDGMAVARGLVSYDAADARQAAGKQSDAIAAVLGYAPRAAMIHRDQMVML
ncbi:MAG: glutamate 5-kinase [Thermaurantiacus sp.]